MHMKQPRMQVKCMCVIYIITHTTSDEFAAHRCCEKSGGLFHQKAQQRFSFQRSLSQAVGVIHMQ